jgi:hypothetical protein
VVSFLFGWLGPNSTIGRAFMAIRSDAMLLATFGLGLMVTNGPQGSMAQLLTGVPWSVLP